MCSTDSIDCALTATNTRVAARIASTSAARRRLVAVVPPSRVISLTSHKWLQFNKYCPNRTHLGHNQRAALGSAYLPQLRCVVGIRDLPVDQCVADYGAGVGQPELAVVRVQPVLQGSEQDHGGLVDAGVISAIYGHGGVSPTHQKIDRAGSHVERLTVEYASGLHDPRGHVCICTEPGLCVLFGDSHFLL